MSTSPPLAVVLLATAVAILLAASSSVSPAAAATVGGRSRYGGGRMVFVHGPARTTTRQVGGARGNEWHYLQAARVEDEVAPELGGILATNSRGGSISAGALDKNRPGCQSGNQCAARAGGSYTRGCTYASRCPH